MTPLQFKKEWQRILKEKDFVSFCQYVQIKDKTSGKYMPFPQSQWHEEQKNFFAARAEREKLARHDVRHWDLVIKPRQIGMTTFGLLQDYFFALCNPGTTTLIVAQEKDISSFCLDSIKSIHEYFESLSKKVRFTVVPKLSMSNKRQIQFSTNSKIVIEVAKQTLAQAEKTGRGLNIDRFHATEVAMWAFPSETMLALEPAFETAKEVLVESTANGASGWFYQKVMSLWNEVQKSMSFNTPSSNTPEKKNQHHWHTKTQWTLHFFPWYLQKNYSMPLPEKSHDRRTGKLYKGKIGIGYTKKAISALYTPENEWEEYLLALDKNGEKREGIGISIQQLLWWRWKVSQHNGNLEKILQEYPIDIHSCFRTRASTILSSDDIAFLRKNVLVPIRTSTINRPPPGCSPTPTSVLPVDIWHEPEEGQRYIIGVDSSYGRGKDYSVATVISAKDLSVVALGRSNKVSPLEFAHNLEYLGRLYNNAILAVEDNASGHSIIETLHIRLHYPNLFSHVGKTTIGFNTNSLSRAQLINLVSLYVEECRSGQRRMPSNDIVQELSTLIIKKTPSGMEKVEAARGTTDDCIMSFGISLMAANSAPKVKIHPGMTTSVKPMPSSREGFGIGSSPFGGRKHVLF